jgi:2,5-diketo-D-gluconate reductase A
VSTQWHIQLGNIVIPKSVNPTRMASNFDVFDFELNSSDMSSISTAETGSALMQEPSILQAGE